MFSHCQHHRRLTSGSPVDEITIATGRSALTAIETLLCGL
jgi:hypothetical protein